MRTKGIGSRGWRLAATAVLVGVVAWASALADTEVTIALEGSITASCSLTGVTTNLDLGNLQNAGAKTTTFMVDCNAPFKYTLASQNGALKHSTILTAPGGFANSLVYSVQTTIPTDSGPGINDTCASSAIKAGASTCFFTNSGSAVAIDKTASLKVSWSTSPSPLLAGSYQDQVTVTVSVQP
ncbi:MAG: hypothetical protein ACREC6_10115 [Hyphomicrobiaceae bacterium]